MKKNKKMKNDKPLLEETPLEENLSEENPMSELVKINEELIELRNRMILLKQERSILIKKKK